MNTGRASMHVYPAPAKTTRLYTSGRSGSSSEMPYITLVIEPGLQGAPVYTLWGFPIISVVAILRQWAWL